ncbi:hypothetical protein [Vulcanococcus limneticus]
MRGQQERTGPLFSYVSTEERIPKAHPLRHRADSKYVTGARAWL